MMNPYRRTLFTAGAATLLLGACSDPPTAPEEELRAWVAAGIEAAENEKRRALIDMISPSYADGRQDRISLLPRIEEITVYDATAAELVVTVGMAGTNDGVLGFSADAYRFAFELERQADEWQLISALWGELGHELQ